MRGDCLASGTEPFCDCFRHKSKGAAKNKPASGIVVNQFSTLLSFSNLSSGLNKLLRVMTGLAFGVCSLLAILLFFAIDSDAFVLSEDSKI